MMGKSHVLTAMLFTSLMLASACGSAKQSPKKSDQVGDNTSPHKLEYSDVMEFVRGVEGSFKISGSLADGSPANITLDGIPEGAVYENSVLTWTPSCDLKPENGQFLHGYMVRRLRINFAGSKTDDLIQKPAIMIVHKTGELSPCP